LPSDRFRVKWGSIAWLVWTEHPHQAFAFIIRLDLVNLSGSRKRMTTSAGRLLVGLLAACLLPPAGFGTEERPPTALPTEPPAKDNAAPADTLAAPTNPFADPTLVDRLLEQAEQHYFHHEHVEALRSLELALQFSPPPARFALETAWSRQFTGDTTGAVPAFREAFRLFPRFVNIYIAFGFVRNETDDFYGALRDFTTAIDLLPVAYLAYSGRAEAKIGLDDYAGAIEDFGVQIRAGHEPALERVYFKRGQARLALGEVEAAGEDFAAAIQADPRFAAAYVFQSYALKYTNRFRESLAALDRAIELAPDDPRAFSARSWTRQELGDPDGARADADQAVALQPNSPDLVLNRAMLHDLLDLPAEARTDYEKAIALAEDKAVNVVWFYAQFHRDLLSRRLEGKPLNAYLADVLTWPDGWQKRIGLFLAGRINADSLLKDAALAKHRPERANQECEARYFIGMTTLLAGDRAAAVRELERCVATNDLQTVEFGMARAQLRRLSAP